MNINMKRYLFTGRTRFIRVYKLLKFLKLKEVNLCVRS